MENINGTMIWYYLVCKREVWLIGHGIESDQENENIQIGKLLHEQSYKRENKEISINNSRMDMIKKKNNKLVIVEIKKSSKTINAAKMQLLYYIYQAKTEGVNITGELRIPKEKRIIKVNLNEQNTKDLEDIINGIKTIINGNIPELLRNSHCRNCAYSEFCWA